MKKFRVITTVEEKHFSRLREALLYAEQEAKAENWKVSSGIYILEGNIVWHELTENYEQEIEAIYDWYIEGQLLPSYRLVAYRGNDGFEVGDFHSQLEAHREAFELANNNDRVEVLQIGYGTWCENGNIPVYPVDYIARNKNED